MKTLTKLVLILIISSFATVDVIYARGKKGMPRAIVSLSSITALGDSVVTLDGSASYDTKRGSIVNYSWKQTSGTHVTLSDVSQPVVTFTAVNIDAQLAFQLTVTDNDGLTNSKSVIVTIEAIASETIVPKAPANITPVANASNDYSAGGNSMVSLNGSASNDVDGTIVSYLWKQTSGTHVTKSDISGPVVTFIAPSVDTDTQLVFQLTVTDDDGATNIDTTTVTILQDQTNQAPSFTSGNSSSILENSLETGYSATAIDPENDVVTFNLTGGADVYAFQIDETTGVLTFIVSSDHQNPGDSNFDNIYEVEISATDSINDSVTKNVSVLVYAENIADKSALPIGIPDPGFGLTDVMPERPFDWSDAVAGYYFVNNDTGTNTNNPYGTPSLPRRTIPQPISAGSYVEVEGNYDHVSSGKITIQSAGTSEEWIANTSGPVWVTGAKTGNSHAFTGTKIRAYGSHLFLDGLTVKNGSRILIGDRTNGFAASYITIRNCDIEGMPSDTASNGALIGVSGEVSTRTSNIVIYNNTVHDIGDTGNTTVDSDAGLFLINWYSSNVWVLNNTGYNAAGNGLQLNHGGPKDATNHIYAGKNEIYNVMQAGMWVKYATDVVFSQNYIHDNIRGSWSPSMGMGGQKEHDRFWMLYNRIENVDYGIRVLTDTTDNNSVYVIGNLIQNVGYETGEHLKTLTGSNAWERAAIHIHGATNRYVYNNTIYNSTNGINISGTVGIAEVYNNVIMNIANTTGRHIWVPNIPSTTQVDNNLVYQAGGEEIIRWNSTNYNLSGFKAAKGACNNCTNLTPDNASNLMDKGADFGYIAQVYYETFGVNLDKDFDGQNRVEGNSIDIGAYETSY